MTAEPVKAAIDADVAMWLAEAKEAAKQRIETAFATSYPESNYFAEEYPQITAIKTAKLAALEECTTTVAFNAFALTEEDIAKLDAVKTKAQIAEAKIGETYYRVFAQALQAAAANDTIVLNNDVEVDWTKATVYSITKNLVIDLNGKTLNAPNYFALRIDGGELTIKNGTITGLYGLRIENETTVVNCEQLIINTAHRAVQVTEKAKVYVKDNCVFTTTGEGLTENEDGSEPTVFVEKGTFEITNSTLEKSTTRGFVLSGNGNYNNVVMLKLDGATVKGGEIAIYMPNAETLTIADSMIEGQAGVYIKSGKTTISGNTTIKSLLAEKVPFAHSGNGAAATGDALIIEACGYPGGNPIVNINGGNFVTSDETAYGVAYYVWNKDETTDNKATITFGEGVYETLTTNIVAKIGTQYYNSFPVALAKAQANDTIVLTNDVEVDWTKATVYSITKNLVIDLNGKTLNAPNYFALRIDGGELTIKNGTITGLYGLRIENETTVVNCEQLIINTAHRAVQVTEKAKVYVKDNCVFTTTGEGLTENEDGSEPTVFVEKGTFEITNSTLEKSTTRGFVLSGNGNYNNVVMLKLDGATVKGGEIAIYMPNAETLTIADSMIEGQAGVYIKSGKTTISGNTTIKSLLAEKVPFAHSGNGAAATGDALIIEACGYPGGNPTVNINGGNFVTTDETACGVAYYVWNKPGTTDDNKATITIGTEVIVNQKLAFTENVCATGYKVSSMTVNGNVVYKIVEETSAAEMPYIVNGIVVNDAESLYTMIAVFGYEATIKLNSDVTINQPFIVGGGNITIDLNGKTLTSNPEATVAATENYAFVIKNGTVNFVDNGATRGKIEGLRGIRVESADAVVNFSSVNIKTTQRCIGLYNGGKVVVNAGTFESTGEDDNESTICVFVGTLEVTNATIKRTTMQGMAISTNGSAASIATVTLTNARISGGEISVYKPDGGTLTIDGGFISGGTGLYVKGGTAVVNGVHVSGELAESVPYGFYGNGATATGDAFVIEACNYPGGFPNVTVKGAFTSNVSATVGFGAYGIAYYQQAPEHNATVSVEDDAILVATRINDNLAALLGKAATVKGYAYNTLATAVEKAENGATITFVNNVETIAYTAVEKSLTFDLNGKTMTSTGGGFDIGGATPNVVVVFKNGTINTVRSCIWAQNGAKVTVEKDVVLNISGTYAGSTGITVEDNGTALIFNGKLTAANETELGISGIGNSSDMGYSITIGATAEITGAEVGVYNPTSTLTIEAGAKITANTAVYIKGGTNVIKGGTFASNLATAVPFTHNNNGANATGDAVVIEACDYPGEKPTVEIQGGMFSCAAEGAYGIAYYQQAPEHNAKEITIAESLMAYVSPALKAFIESQSGDGE